MTKVTKAGAKDINNFFKFFERTLTEGYFLFAKENAAYIVNAGLPKKAQFKKELLKGDSPLYLIYKNKRLIGYLLTQKDFAGAAHGDWLAVDREFQNKGIASKLLRAWEQDVLNQGGHVLQLWTTENDFGFYKKRGFTLGGKFEKAWFGIDHYLFYKIIAKPNPKKYI